MEFKVCVKESKKGTCYGCIVLSFAGRERFLTFDFRIIASLLSYCDEHTGESYLASYLKALDKNSPADIAFFPISLGD